MMWKQGDGALGEYTVKAGTTYNIGLELDWSDEEIARDFSVVVHGMGGGGLTLTKVGGAASATLPVLERAGQEPNPAPAPAPEEEKEPEPAPAPAPAPEEEKKDEAAEDTFSNTVDTVFNAWVNSYTPENNFGPCGSWLT